MPAKSAEFSVLAWAGNSTEHLRCTQNISSAKRVPISRLAVIITITEHCDVPPLSGVIDVDNEDERTAAAIMRQAHSQRNPSGKAT